jgi:hypothetical protein
MKLHYIKHYFLLALLCYLGTNTAFTQNVTITVDPSQGKRAISPYIYGRNNTFDKPASFYSDAGLRFVRMCGGNNATKYNWRRKITSHPDWYNNVYGNSWDEMSEYIAENHPKMQVMWAFQLLGRVASNSDHNFNDWGFNSSQWWEGVHQNLAGGGVPNTDVPGGKALVEGDIGLYTMEWPADSTVAILNHWFEPDGLGLNKNQFAYWSMDNEPDVWNGTHDDVMGDVLLPSVEFMDHFIEVAKKARAQFPEIKICGPVTTSEWQWYKWGAESITINGKYYSWIEYFIKRCADEEKASGIRVLDVVDLHHYPYAPTDNDALQNHRIFYDMEYNYPGANGLKTINGGWDNSLTKEYIFQRIDNWLIQYFGENHGITMGLSEWSPGPNEPNLASVIYGTHLGTFANHGVDFFTPWNWFTGMWETLHLFSRYARSYNVSSTSSLENTVSAYTSLNETSDSMTIIIVNRDMNSERNVTVNLNNCIINDGNYTTLQLSSLPSAETFISHSDNAITESTVEASSNSFTITVPALSTTAVLFSSIVVGIENYYDRVDELKIFPNPVSDRLTVNLNSDIPQLVIVTIYNQDGREVQTFTGNYDGISGITLDISALAEGFYLLSVRNGYGTKTGNFAVVR